MELFVRHRTVYRYAEPVQRVSLLLRLMPTDCDTQAIVHWDVVANWHAPSSFSLNSFGDFEAHCLIDEPVTELVIEANGIVEVQDAHGLVSGFKRQVVPDLFLRSTPLTKPGEKITKLSETVRGSSQLDRLHELAALIREKVRYTSGITSWQTPAEEALALGQGVCQDHTHIFVSAARLMGLPARYVAGYFLAVKAEDALHETHGWAEAYVSDLGWVGFDVANGMCVTDHHVRLCSGLDAHHAAPIRGSVFGATQNAIDADVVISEADAGAHAQIQQQQ